MTRTKKTLVFVGGSFGGIASLTKFVNLCVENEVDPQMEINVYLIEPRAGFINILGIPLAFIDVEFAKKSYMNVEKYHFKFNTIESNSQDLVKKVMNAPVKLQTPSNLKINFIHGKCLSFIDEHNLNYQLNEADEIKQLSFDYCVFATGRRRAWPFDPVALTEEQMTVEMTESKEKVDAADTITVIGGGALGIEVAGELKHNYKDKTIKLIHPHPYVPPEFCASNNLKRKLDEFLNDIGVEILYNTRVEKELENKDLLTTDGRTITSDLNLWCNFHKNNIEPLLPAFQDSLQLSTSEVILDERLVMKGHENIFVVGDVVNFKIVKTCGGAWSQGEKAAQSLFNLMVLGKEEYEVVDLVNWPRGMTIVVGKEQICSQYNDIGDGEIVVNAKEMMQYYEDYGCKSQREKLGIDE